MAGKQAQSQATWVVEWLVAENKAQGLFAATEGLVHKWSSILIRILAIEVQISEKKTNLTSLVIVYIDF